MRDQGVQGGRRRGRFWRVGRFNGHRLRIVQHRGRRWVHTGFVRRRARKGKLLPRRDWRTPEHQRLPALAGGRGCKPRAGLRRQGDNNRPGRVQRHNVAALYRSRQRPYTVCDGSRDGRDRPRVDWLEDRLGCRRAHDGGTEAQVTPRFLRQATQGWLRVIGASPF